jgi:ElaB/YqjD/DUF883 family membrane-anchored ribosome-binding protein
MSTSATMDEIAGQGSNGARRMGRPKRGAESIKRNASPEFADLIADVEDLVQKVGHIADSEVAQVRERLREKIASAKESMANQRIQFVAAARYAAGTADDFVHENPWKSTGIAALAGIVLGLIIFRK